MKMIKFPLLLLLSIFLLTDCKKDSKTENPDATADEITDWLKIDGAVKKSGNSPSPTTGAPVLTNLSPTTGGVTDANFSFKFSASDDFLGVYLKVKGSSSYLDIPLSSTGGKAGKGKLLGGGSEKGIAFRGGEEEDEIIVIIDLDDASNPEEFCYEYCLYDAENEVSNIVEVCVTIAYWGGLDQLVGKWKNDKISFNDGGDFIEYDDSWGSLDSNAFCGGSDGVDVFNQYSYMEFFSDGIWMSYFDLKLINGLPLTSCINEGYYNRESKTLGMGKWSFNVLTNELIFVLFKLIRNQGTPIEYINESEIGELDTYSKIITLNENDFVIESLFIEDFFQEKYKRY